MMDKAHSVSWIGAAMAVTGQLSLNDWLGIIGVSLALVGMVANIWYKRKMLSIEREKLEREFPKE